MPLDGRAVFCAGGGAACGQRRAADEDARGGRAHGSGIPGGPAARVRMPGVMAPGASEN